MRTVKLLLVLTIATTVVACSKSKKKTTTVESKREAPGPVAETKQEPEKTAAAPEPEAKPAASLTPTIYFEFDSSNLDDKAREELNNNAKWLKEDAKRTLLIEGHTDEKGTPEYNLSLGERRARASRDYLVRLGIASKRIRIITYGEEKPATPGADDANRRSVFVATKKK